MEDRVVVDVTVLATVNGAPDLDLHGSSRPRVVVS